MIPRLPVTLAVLCIFTLHAAPAQTAESRVANWTGDLEFLARELPARHKNAFFCQPREKFEERVAALRARLPALNDIQVVTELRILVASIGDGHTMLGFGRSEEQ